MYPTADVLLPTWWRAVWVVLLLGVLVVLALAAARVTGRPRAWHAVYAGAAACMVVMYAANPMDTPGFNGAALTVFVIALIGLATVVVAGFRGGITAPWVIAVVDVVTLAYIQIPADVRPVIVCVLFACYLAVQVALRLTVAVRALRGAPQRASRTLVDPSGRPTSDGLAAPTTTRADAVVPIALAVLALGMLYMLSV
ncbi:hypothetical protein GCM10023201_12060 [Actinomycetospora corticicola]|uniref:Uncharacterized protein n=1 Tax=Actinomycetospora corticicola TaxID=663602 RepID=A0A7Y9J868_9PSEU|nr:hypothetical protein [Actinomycetospora corticicola]NYD38781.1 hypothetical protein [Actinomycetospora corticicola]